MVLLCVNSISVKLATIVQTVFTALKMFALVIIIIGGFAKLGQGLLGECLFCSVLDFIPFLVGLQNNTTMYEFVSV